MARYGKKNSAPETKITKEAGLTGISLSSSIIIFIITTGKRLI